MDYKLTPEEANNWVRDRAGAIADEHLAKKLGWKVGDKITINGTIYPVNLELTIRGLFKPQPSTTLCSSIPPMWKKLCLVQGRAGTFVILADSPKSVSTVASAVDDTFRNSPQPTKTESEKAFLLGFISMLGNVKAFILFICGAVVFAILLVSANTMAMSIRERTREVAVLKTLDFTRKAIFGTVRGRGSSIGHHRRPAGLAGGDGIGESHFQNGRHVASLQVNGPTMAVAMVVACLVAF